MLMATNRAETLRNSVMTRTTKILKKRNKRASRRTPTRAQRVTTAKKKKKRKRTFSTMTMKATTTRLSFLSRASESPSVARPAPASSSSSSSSTSSACASLDEGRAVAQQQLLQEVSRAQAANKKNNRAQHVEAWSKQER